MGTVASVSCTDARHTPPPLMGFPRPRGKDEGASAVPLSGDLLFDRRVKKRLRGKGMYRFLFNAYWKDDEHI